MTILAICSVLIGAIIGFRYRIVVLPPLIGFGAGALIAIDMTHGVPTSQIIWSMLTFVISLQCGYIGALVIRRAPAGASASALLSIKSAD